MAFMRPQNTLMKYVEEVTGERPKLEELPVEQVAGVPLYLKVAYSLVRMTLFQRELLLAVHKSGGDLATPSEYSGHARQLGRALGEETILVLPRLASYTRNRLVRRGVPFIVPGRQMFLPTLLVDLREWFPRPVREGSSGKLSSAAQVVVLYHLLGNEAEGIPLKELAARVGYSAMTLSNVRDELQAGSLCKVVKRGRSRHLVFTGPRQGLWRSVEERLRSPVQARHWVRWEGPPSGALMAGISALAHLTHLSDDEMPTFALRASRYRRQLEKGGFHGCAGPDDADALIEAWAYDPEELATDDVVDRLSLYLSLRDSEEERVESALRSLLAEVQW